MNSEKVLLEVAARLVQSAYAEFREKHPQGTVIEFVLVAASPDEDPRDAVTASERVDLEHPFEQPLDDESSDEDGSPESKEPLDGEPEESLSDEDKKVLQT